MSCNTDCTSIGSHELVDCGLYLKGGISAMGLLECNHSISNFGTGSQLQTAINQGKLIVIKPIKGEIPEPSPVEGENPSGCGSETILDGFDRTFVWDDFNVTAANIDFYNALNRRVYYLLIYHCQDAQLTVVQTKASFVAKLMTPKSNKEKRKYSVTAKWTAFNEAPIYDLDATGQAIFDTV